MNLDSNIDGTADLTVTSSGDGRVSGNDRRRVDLRRVLTGLRSKHEAAAEVIGGRCSLGNGARVPLHHERHETQVRCPSNRVVRTIGETVQAMWNQPVS